MELKTHDVPETHCLDCGKKLNAASSVTQDEQPSPGDATVCLHCGHLMIFADDFTMRAPTDAEMYQLAGDPTLLLNQRFAAQFRRWKAKQQGER